jgi:hypothetical protein
MSDSPRGIWQVGLGTILFLGVPWAAALAWIVALDGPYFDPRRVVTHKLALLILLFATGFIVLVFRKWLRVSRVFVAIWLIVFALMAVATLRNREQSIERQRQYENSQPAAVRNALHVRP